MIYTQSSNLTKKLIYLTVCLYLTEEQVPKQNSVKNFKRLFHNLWLVFDLLFRACSLAGTSPNRDRDAAVLPPVRDLRPCNSAEEKCAVENK